MKTIIEFKLDEVQIHHNLMPSIDLTDQMLSLVDDDYGIKHEIDLADIKRIIWEPEIDG